MPEARFEYKSRREILSYEQIESITETAAKLGITKVRLTGGDVATTLKRSGLARVNVSIDSLDADKYSRITRGGDLRKALAGVDAAIKAELTPIKINMVILDDTTEKEIETMKAFCEQRHLQLQKIMQFSLYDRADLSKRFRTERPPECSHCNRLRLTADGFLKPCLFSDDEVKVDFNDIAGSILEAVAKKPVNGSSCRNRFMSQIGG